MAALPTAPRDVDFLKVELVSCETISVTVLAAAGLRGKVELVSLLFFLFLDLLN